MVEVATNEIVLEGLSMPHSPRWHDAGEGERLWLLDSGAGRFGHADLERGRFERVTFCPGYSRGLACYGHFAGAATSIAATTYITLSGKSTID